MQLTSVDAPVHQLSVLSMSWNRIESPLPLSLWELNVLRTLNLDHNQIDEIPGDVEKLSRLCAQVFVFTSYAFETRAQKHMHARAHIELRPDLEHSRVHADKAAGDEAVALATSLLL